jgi:3-hydroxyisobutyrate dehydrogenase
MKIGFLGLGTMGIGMASKLADNGFDVSVWNRSPGKAEALAASGVRVAATPFEAAAGADAVIAMVADDRASAAVWLGANGALAGMPATAIAIECSTVTVDWTSTLAAAAAERGVAFVDAPVTGSKSQAASGDLRFLVGGEAAVVDRARPVFDVMGAAVIPCGPVGSGAMLKLINNYLCGIQVASLAEALAMAERSGLDIETVANVLTEGAPGSPLVKTLSRRMIDRDYAPNFIPGLMAKDLRYAADAMAGVGITSAIAEAARARFVDGDQQGHAADDIASIIEPLRAALVATEPSSA